MSPLLLSALVASLPALTLPAEPSAPAPEGPSDRALRRAWGALEEAERREVAEWFRLEAGGLRTFQGGLVQHVLGQLESDPGLWPERGVAPLFDPREHAPGQVIPRERLDPGSSRAERVRDAILGARPERRLRSAWGYDWARGEPVRVGDPDDPELVFENALAGWLPDADVAEVVVLRLLDRGEERAALAAWSHGYTDRSGNAFPGVTLYDAWSSGNSIEMPDVDVLGLYHTLTGDVGRYVAPVPNSRHEELYGALGERFRHARAYRQLREAAARTYLAADPVLPRGYEASLARLHALWEEHASAPAALAETLPDGEGWGPFLESWAERCAEEPELLTGGAVRRDALAADALAVRALLVSVMRRFGALD